MRILVGIVLVATALAGCVDDESFTPNAVEPCVVESADDFSCAELPVGNPDEVAHIHDYWQGLDRMTILDYARPASPTSGGLITNCDGWPEYELHADEGFSVIQGTQFVEVTMDWGDEPYDLYSDPQLWIQTASMRNPEMVKEITPGETVVFESTNADNDLPHSLLSSWKFVWHAMPEENDPFCHISHRSEFSIKVDIVKGLDIPVFPAHPDQWDGGNITEMEVLYEEGTVTHYNDGISMCFASPRCLWDPWLLNDEAIIPYDTERIEVEMDVQPRNGAPFTADLGYHGSDSRELIWVDPLRIEGSKQFYEMDVERIQADGPYAIQSQWEFWVTATGETEEFSGDIILTVTAHKSRS